MRGWVKKCVGNLAIASISSWPERGVEVKGEGGGGGLEGGLEGG